MKLKESIIEKIKYDQKLRISIAVAAERTEDAVRRWIRDEDQESLTKYPVLKTIQDHTGIEIDDMIENTPAPAIHYHGSK